MTDQFVNANKMVPITPPPELIAKWASSMCGYYEAARWGADTELEACVTEVSFWGSRSLAEKVRAARRPKPEGPTDEELRELWNDGWDTSEEHGAFKFARAVLARWGRPAPQPVDGEVAELVAWLRKTSSAAFMDGWPNEESINIGRAADLLERLSPPQPS